MIIHLNILIDFNHAMFLLNDSYIQQWVFKKEKAGFPNLNLERGVEVLQHRILHATDTDIYCSLNITFTKNILRFLI